MPFPLPLDRRAAAVDLASRYFEAVADEMASIADTPEPATFERHLSIARHLAHVGISWLEEAENT
jgi:hypothetical protein